MNTLGIARSLRDELQLIFVGLLSIFSFWIECFFRHTFGERYYSNIAALFSIAIYWGMYALLRATGTMLMFSSSYREVQSTNTILIIFGVLLTVLLVGHRIRIDILNNEGQRWHSRSHGTSWMASENDRFVKIFGEPIAALVIAALMWLVCKPLTPILALGAVALFIKELIYQQQLRNQYLDMVDNSIEAEGFEQLYNRGWNDSLGVYPPKLLNHSGFTALIPSGGQEVGNYIAASAARNPILAERLRKKEQEAEEKHLAKEQKVDTNHDSA